jgi:hypothetical protein
MRPSKRCQDVDGLNQENVKNQNLIKAVGKDCFALNSGGGHKITQSEELMVNL